MNLKALFIKYIKHRENLNKGKIYKLVDNTNENIYIGSTCNSLNKRLSQHNSHYKRYLKRQYGNMKSFDIIKNNDFTIKLLEKCNIKTKQELYQRERYYIENNESVNKRIPCRTNKEYIENNKDKLNEKMKEYQAAYRDNNKDKIKEYREANKDKIKEYREANKDKIKEKQNEKFICPCGGRYTCSNKVRHFKNHKHQEFLINK